MAEQTKKRGGGLLIYLLTPLLLMILTGGVLVLCYVLAPSHQLQKYLNLAFMDNLKTSSTSSGLRIIENEIDMNDTGETAGEGEIIYPTFGEQYAMLEARSIDLTVGVYYGATSELLARGACQPTGSAIIGEGGNTVIDAHVNTYFSDLEKLRVGDQITLYTMYGVFTYRVAEQITFDKNDKRYVNVTDEEYLTLYTCKPQVLGSSDVRIGVRCVPVEKKFRPKSAD